MAATYDPIPAGLQALVTQVQRPVESVSSSGHVGQNLGVDDDGSKRYSETEVNLSASSTATPTPVGEAPLPNVWPKRTNFFSRLMCCTSLHTTGSGLVPPPHHSSLGVNGSNVKQTSPTTNGLVTTANSRSPSSVSLGGVSTTEFESLKRHGKKLLALDLDETLVHSSFQPVPRTSFMISVEIDGTSHTVYVVKRPGVDEFLERMSKHYEILVYTASLSKYADPLLDILDKNRCISRRLFREHCVFYDGHYVKDLACLGSDLASAIIVDNSPMSYIFQPDNAIDCSSFFDDPRDVELWQIGDFLENISNVSDVRTYCRYWREWCKAHPSGIPTMVNSGGSSAVTTSSTAASSHVNTMLTSSDVEPPTLASR